MHTDKMKWPALLINSATLTFLMCCLDSIVTVCSSSSSSVEVCPASCSCFFADSPPGGSIVNCSARNLTSLPADLPEDTLELLAEKNALESVSPLPVLAKLKKLNLRQCHLKSLNSQAESVAVHSGNLPSLLILDLSENDLEAIPRSLPSTLQTLHLSHNSIHSIQPGQIRHLRDMRELFLDHNNIVHLTAATFMDPEEKELADPVPYFPQLQRLALNRNRISKLEPLTFQPLQMLTALTLSGNRITHLKAGTFTGLSELQHLDLSDCHLVTVANNTFKELESLKHLYLNNNRMTSVPWGLPMLEWLDLSRNLLQTFPEEFKTDLFPAEVFNIAGNPLMCDCHMVWLKELYDRREYLFKHLNVDSADFIPVCQGPASVAGESWDVLSDALFLCEEKQRLGSFWPPAVPQPEGRVMGKLVVKCGMVTDTTIEVHWAVEGPTTFTTLYVHYYVFGMRSKTSKFTEVLIRKHTVTLEGLHPQTNFVVCLIPKVPEVDPEKLAPLSLEHCVETQTKEPPPVLIVSYLTVFWYYLLGMLTTVIAVFSCIGGLALVYGILSSKTDWSAKHIAQEIDARNAPQEAAEGMSSASVSLNSVLRKGEKAKAD